MANSIDPMSVPRIPAPWTLRGRGFVMLYRFPEEFVRAEGFVPDALRERFAGGIGAVMLVDYAESNIGPYGELLFIPGDFRHQGRRRSSITRIYVSTEISVVNGRINWGIPKDLARFEWDRVANVDRVQVFDGQRRIASIALRGFGPHLPMTTSVIPRGARTLVQRDENWTYLTTLSGRGWFRPASVVEAKVEPAAFPDFSRGRLLGAFEVDPFELRFPAAVMEPAGGRQ